METPRDGPGEAVAAHWADLREDVAALQAEYAAEDWDLTVLHPGEITPRRGDGPVPAVLDVLVPDNELAAVTDLVESDGVDDVDVYRETADGTVFLVVVVLSSGPRRGFIYPAFYAVPAADVLIEEARAEGVFRVRFRNLATDDAVLVEHPDPAPFVPD